MFPSLVSVLLQYSPWPATYLEACVLDYQTIDHLHVFGTISAFSLLQACKTHTQLERKIKQRDTALELPLHPSEEGIVGPYDDDDRETLVEFIEWVWEITLHRHESC